MLVAQSQNAKTHIIIYDLKLFSLSTYSDISLHNIFKNKTSSKQYQCFISKPLSVPASIIRLSSILAAICIYKNSFLSPHEIVKELMMATTTFKFHHLDLWALSLLYIKIVVELDKPYNILFFISTEWKMKWRKIVSHPVHSRQPSTLKKKLPSQKQILTSSFSRAKRRAGSGRQAI